MRLKIIDFLYEFILKKYIRWQDDSIILLVTTMFSDIL